MNLRRGVCERLRPLPLPPRDGEDLVHDERARLCLTYAHPLAQDFYKSDEGRHHPKPSKEFLEWCGGLSPRPCAAAAPSCRLSSRDQRLPVYPPVTGASRWTRLSRRSRSRSCRGCDSCKQDPSAVAPLGMGVPELGPRRSAASQRPHARRCRPCACTGFSKDGQSPRLGAIIRSSIRWRAVAFVPEQQPATTARLLRGPNPGKTPADSCDRHYLLVLPPADASHQSAPPPSCVVGCCVTLRFPPATTGERPPDSQDDAADTLASAGPLVCDWGGIRRFIVRCEPRLRLLMPR